MKKICRLNITYAGSIDNGGKSMDDVLQAEMNKGGVTLEDIEVHEGDSYSQNTHFGNWVLTPVLDNEATAKLAARLGTTTDMHSEIIDAEDITAVNIGDRVAIRKMDAFCSQVKMEGRVVDKTKHSIDILKKGTRSGRGWRIYAGEEAFLRVINSYQTTTNR